MTATLEGYGVDLHSLTDTFVGVPPSSDQDFLCACQKLFGWEHLQTIAEMSPRDLVWDDKHRPCWMSQEDFDRGRHCRSPDFFLQTCLRLNMSLVASVIDSWRAKRDLRGKAAEVLEGQTICSVSLRLATALPKFSLPVATVCAGRIFATYQFARKRNPEAARQLEPLASHLFPRIPIGYKIDDPTVLFELNLACE